MTATYSINFVCTGNICRSPMAEVMARQAIQEAGLGELVKVASCGVDSWHVGEGADERTVAELHKIGLDGTEHIAQQFGPQAGDTDLFIAMDTGHRSQLIARGVDENRVALMRSFDPTAEEEPSVADPYYGGSDGFTRVRKEIEASLPGLLEYIQDQLR
ncbi:low molecular weight protein-tyrosine-phosphatase [Corynebacterium pseudodiphtheriticum]|mgnify:FL=1|uniref:low molecular weight protein-tyrosine-phosphatase n=1 Tax=Corynebacterium pseudodiphtheriticum TaxID=37637 RepID=UPI00254D8E85|nr:low molecular weight protein-tyrosine-phosphatase [Corynebacterium pseudodiphtheriticum]MDK8760185.1 low molecular weight protein-tyrosine-phosphatase [Corynebacterium pseudodiphtheriticum]